MKNNHQISTFLKSEQQSRMMHPTILKLLRKKQRDYDRRHMCRTEIKVDDIMLLKNNKRFDWNGGKFSQKWLGPDAVIYISDKGVVTLKNASGMTLKNK